MTDSIFKEGSDVIGVIDWKLDNLRKAASVCIFLLLLNGILLCIILGCVI